MAQADSNHSTVRERIQKKTARKKADQSAPHPWERYGPEESRWVGDMLDILMHPEIQQLRDRHERDMDAAIDKVRRQTRRLRVLPGGKE